MNITLRTLPQATEQEVFDQVAIHLLRQNRKSHILNDTCAYRGADGLKCAAGCLIADNEYSPGMETLQWAGLVRRQVVPGFHSQLVRSLQDIHDQFPVQEWKAHLLSFANTNNLSTSVLETPADS